MLARLALVFAILPALLGLTTHGVTPAVADQIGPDWVASDNVEYIDSIKQDAGLTTGAKVVGDRLFVTSGKNITVYDISTPEKPQTMGSMKLNLAWQNEEVPTNGKLLAFASDTYSATDGCLSHGAAFGCVEFFDVRDPSNITSVGAVPIANHTIECALDCTWFYGEQGTIIDARGILDGRPPKVAGNWIDELKAQGVTSRSCHHIREIRPGVLLTACRPFAVITINPSDAKGASPARPKLLYTGESNAFVHAARWPRGGRDDFLLTGGELNFTGRCELAESEFRVYSAERVNRGLSKEFDGPIAGVPPAGSGLYVDGKPPVSPVGCSIHWFQEHRTFRNGGLVALSEYEDGVRFLQVTNDGRIVEQGFFTALGGASSSSKWAPTGDVLYSVDYDRGIDIIRWKGQHYVPKANGRGLEPEQNRMRGTNGVSALGSSQIQRRTLVSERLAAQGPTPFACRLAAEVS